MSRWICKYGMDDCVDGVYTNVCCSLWTCVNPLELPTLRDSTAFVAVCMRKHIPKGWTLRHTVGWYPWLLRAIQGLVWVSSAHCLATTYPQYSPKNKEWDGQGGLPGTRCMVVLDANSDNLSTIPSTHVAVEENWLPTPPSCPLASARRLFHVHMQNRK